MNKTEKKLMDGVKFALTGMGAHSTDPAFQAGVECVKGFQKDGEDLGLTLQDYCETALEILAHEEVN